MWRPMGAPEEEQACIDVFVRAGASLAEAFRNLEDGLDPGSRLPEPSPFDDDNTDTG